MYRNILTGYKALVFKMKTGFVPFFAGNVVVKSPRPARPVTEMTDFVRRSGAKFDHAKIIAVLLPMFSVDFSFTIERGPDQKTKIGAAVRMSRLTRELEPNPVKAKR